MSDLRAWLRDGNHLPAPLKDFHDAKDVFKSLHEWVASAKPEQRGPFQRPSWIDGQCYVMDDFLAFMAAHGWTMQRSRAKLTFADLRLTIKNRREKEAIDFRGFLDKSGGSASGGGENRGE